MVRNITTRENMKPADLICTHFVTLISATRNFELPDFSASLYKSNQSVWKRSWPSAISSPTAPAPQTSFLRPSNGVPSLSWWVIFFVRAEIGRS
jgi:hypothetical protein